MKGIILTDNPKNRNPAGMPCTEAIQTGQRKSGLQTHDPNVFSSSLPIQLKIKPLSG
jgi:hypothetical protein